MTFLFRGDITDEVHQCLHDSDFQREMVLQPLLAVSTKQGVGEPWRWLCHHEHCFSIRGNCEKELTKELKIQSELYIAT